MSTPTPPRAIVTSGPALMQPVPRRGDLEAATRLIKVGESLDVEGIRGRLAATRGVDVLFVPETKAVYPAEPVVRPVASTMADGLEGAARQLADGLDRLLLRGAAVIGAAAASGPADLLSKTADATLVAPLDQRSAAAAARDAFENLTAEESDILEAIVARLIPTDALGPGATEARAAHYIDRALGGALSSSREAYRVGLAYGHGSA